MFACMCIQSYSMIGLFCKRALKKLLQKSPTKAFAKEPYKRDSIFAKEPTIRMHVCVFRAIQRLHWCVYRLRLSFMYMYFGLFCVCKNKENENLRERVWQNDRLFEREKTHARERERQQRSALLRHTATHCNTLRERERQQRSALSIYNYDYRCVRVCFWVWGCVCVFNEGYSVKVFLGECKCVWACVSVGCSECR